MRVGDTFGRLVVNKLSWQACRGHRCGAVQPHRCFAAGSETLYELIGVARTATKLVIKAAFRKRARELHPDVSGDKQNAAFVSLVQAYEVLVDDHKRQLYDLSLDSRAGRIAKEASLGREAQRVEDGTERGEWMQGGGWRAWVVDNAKASRPDKARTEIDRLRAELRGDFRSALRHAYLGPRLEVGNNELPEAFEAEERSVPGLGDLLHLVSGQTLLGSVRERHAQSLGTTRHRAAHVEPGSGALLELGKHDASSHREAMSISADATVSALTNGRSSAPVRSWDVRGAEQETSPNKQPARGNEDHSPHGGEDLRREHARLEGRSATRSRGKQPADVLDLYITSDTGEQLVATAVRQCAVDAASEDPASSNLDLGSRRLPDVNADSGTATASMITVFAADDEGEGRMLCRVDQKGHIHPATQHRSGVQHLILSSATPFVRSLHFVVHTGRKKTVMCRAKRAWLPPSATWLFPPRCATHTNGGWYLEWGGYKHRDHPLWLDPAVYVLAAAFNSLDTERARAATDVPKRAGSIAWSASEDLALSPWNPKQWARLFLGFHGWRRRRD